MRDQTSSIEALDRHTSCIIDERGSVFSSRRFKIGGMDSQKCAWCGERLEPRAGRGRPAVYCSARCRRYGYEQRRAASRVGDPVQVVTRQSAPEVVERVRQRWSQPEPQQVAEALDEDPELAGPVLRRIVELATNGRLSERSRVAVGKQLGRFAVEAFRARVSMDRRPATGLVRELSAEQWGVLAAVADRSAYTDQVLAREREQLNRSGQLLEKREAELTQRTQQVQVREDELVEQHRQVRELKRRLRAALSQSASSPECGHSGSSFFRS